MFLPPPTATSRRCYLVSTIGLGPGKPPRPMQAERVRIEELTAVMPRRPGSTDHPSRPRAELANSFEITHLLKRPAPKAPPACVARSSILRPLEARRGRRGSPAWRLAGGP